MWMASSYLLRVGGMCVHVKTYYTECWVLYSTHEATENPVFEFDCYWM